MRRARRDEADRAGPTRDDGPVIVTGGDPLDFRMARNQIGKRRCGLAHHRIHRRHADPERRMVHEH